MLRPFSDRKKLLASDNSSIFPIVNVFFITGQPRSRTAWLANLFTYKDSHCFHDAIKRCATPREMKDLFEKTQKSTGVRYVGNSDSGIPFIMDELLAEFPGAKLVVIERKQEDVVRSFKRTFPQMKDQDVVDVIGKTQLALDRAKKKYDPLVIDFEELTRENTVRQLWSYCLPEIPFDRERWNMLDGFRVEIIPGKYIADFMQDSAQRISNLIRNYR